MCGVHVHYFQNWVLNILSPLSMIILELHGYIFWNFILKYFLWSKFFYSEIKNQFNSRIKILRSDNAKEYLDNYFSHLLKQNVIWHQASCVYTSQQNEIAERKNKHLDITRTLLFHGQIPKEFWDDVILTTCYLINECHPLYCKIKSHIPSWTQTRICSLSLQNFLGLFYP